MATSPNTSNASLRLENISAHSKVFRHNEITGTMQAWFAANFEAPDVRLKIDQESGKYLFRYGGPFEANKVLVEHFIGKIDRFGDPYNQSHSTRAASYIVDADGITDWSPKPNSEYYKETHSEADIAATQQEQIDLILERVDELKRDILKLKTDDPLIGDNRPPEEIGLPPYHDEDRIAILDLLDGAKTEILSKSPRPDVLQEKGEAIIKKSQAFADYLKTGAKAVIGEIAKKSVDLLFIDTNRIGFMNSLHQVGLWIVDLVRGWIS